ncbi:MAG: hypothetical protein V1778_01680 [bacterium]
MKNPTPPQDQPEVTNEDLARMIAEGFAQTATKSELHAVEGRLTRVEMRLTTVEEKVDRALYSEYTHLERRVTRLEKKTGILE